MKILKMKSRYFFITLILAAPSFASTDVSRDFWLGTFNKVKLTSKSFLWSETQLRYNVEDSEMGQTLIRGGLLRKIGKKNQEVGLLYAFIQSGVNKEHRLALQHTMRYSESVNLSHRVRLEYRALENQKPLDERFRYLFRYQSLKKRGLGLPVIWDEVFVNLDKKPNDKIDYLDRNRLFIGFRSKFEEFNFEYGYLNQYAPREGQSVMDHTLVAYLFF